MEYKIIGKVYWYNRIIWFEFVECFNKCKWGLFDLDKFFVYNGVCKGKGRDVLCLLDIKKYILRWEIIFIVCNKRLVLIYL